MSNIRCAAWAIAGLTACNAGAGSAPGNPSEAGSLEEGIGTTRDAGSHSPHSDGGYGADTGRAFAPDAGQITDAPAVDVVVKGAADAPAADVVGEGAANSNILTVTSPSNGATISGTVVFKGQAGSEWVNIAAYDETNAGAKVGSDVTPSNGSFAISVDTTQLASGMTSFSITGFSVPPGQSGGTSRSVGLTVNIANPAQGLVYGANLHANGDYGNGAAAAIDTQFQIMQARKLTQARIGGVPDGSADAATSNWIAAGTTYGVGLSFMLDIAWIVCPNDDVTFASEDATTNYNATYQATLATATKFRDSITLWELGNEIDLKAGQSGPPSSWNEGWTAADWQNVSAYGSSDYYANWASAIKGAADAIAAVNTQYGTHLVRVLNTTGTHVGFLDYMTANGVNFEEISYHYYYSSGTSPYALAASPPGSTSNSWDLFQGLGAYGLPVTINEMNCAEIYQTSFQNSASDPLYTTCLTNLRTQLGYMKHQTEMNLKSVYVYELLDEPSQTAPENHFGLFWNDGQGNYTPKVNLYLWSAFSGGALSAAETSALTSYGLLPLP